MNNNEKNKVHSTANVVNPQANANTNSIVTNDLPTVKKNQRTCTSRRPFNGRKAICMGCGRESLFRGAGRNQITRLAPNCVASPRWLR